MEPQTSRIGATTFRKMTKVSAAEVRALESIGVIHPLKSDSGWRSFDAADVAAIAAWRAKQALERAARTAERAARIRGARCA